MDPATAMAIVGLVDIVIKYYFRFYLLKYLHCESC